MTYSIVTQPATSTDPNYNNLNPADVSISNSDDDTAGITLTPQNGLTTDESGGSDSFNVRLDTLPTDNVTLSLSGSDTSEVTVSPASLTFTPGNALTSQTVMVTGKNDTVIDGDIAFTIMVSTSVSNDTIYTALSAVSASGSNLDNDMDSDSDGVIDELDNCVNDSNPDQENTDNDSEGNVCDPDDDNDGVLDSPDNCPLVANADQLDSNGNGTGDACEAGSTQDDALCFPVLAQNGRIALICL